MWKVDLNELQKKKVKDQYFIQAWSRFAEDGNLNYKDSYRFLKELMTTALQPKNQKATGLFE